MPLHRTYVESPHGFTVYTFSCVVSLRQKSLYVGAELLRFEKASSTYVITYSHDKLGLGLEHEFLPVTKVSDDTWEANDCSNARDDEWN
jgi:hypothetical protein